ncbi:MAG: DUF6062 family protein [Anaerolineae bacterium]|nr:DUF6062 family protein [Candidatus Roseilinea sp.]MDW8451371.1 DUF6062 family protein [Anaerolineae bacterium]
MRPKSSAYYELIEAMSQPGCPICRLVDRAVRQYVDVFFYESVTNVERRAEIREARGYCSVHGALLAGHARMLGIAIIQHDVINDVLREVNRILPEARAQRRPLDQLTGAPMRRAILGAVKPKRACPLCEYERDQEGMLLHALAGEIQDEAMHHAFARSSGLCLPHLQALLQLRGVASHHLRLLLQIERDILTALKAELEEYLAKSNGSYDYAGMGREADSPLRAVKLVSGRVIGRR